MISFSSSFKIPVIIRVMALSMLFLYPQLLFAQHSITVRDEANQLPLEQVQIEILNDQQQVIGSAFTNRDGKAELTNPPPAQLRIWLHGYEMLRHTTSASAEEVLLKASHQELDNVVVTGVVIPVAKRDALNVVHSISKTTLDQMGAVTLDQALAYQPNITLGTDAVLGTTIRMMGMSGNNVKVLIDGLPVNGRENGNINLSQINLYNTQRIEVINGPMSLIYGSDALGGVINVITKGPSTKKNVQLTSQYETVGRYNAYLQGTLPFLKRHSIGGGIGRNFFEGYQFLDTGVLQRRMLFKPTEQYPAHLLYTYHAPSGFKAQLATDAVKETIQDKGSASISSYGAYAQDQYYITHRAANRLLLSGKLTDNMYWQSGTSYMFYQRRRETYSKDLVQLTQELVPSAFVQDTSIFIDFNQRASLEHKAGRLSYTIGFDVTNSSARSKKITTGYAALQDFAAFAALQTQLWKERLSLQAGVRAANNSMFKVPVLPSAQLLFKPVKNVQFRANYTQAYRAPSLKEMYLEFIDPQHMVIGNASLQSEEGTHYQAALAWQLYEKGNNYLQWTLNGFHNRVTNQISLVPINPNDSNSIEYAYGNVSSLQNSILNAELQWQQDNLYLQLGYNWGHTYLPDYGQRFREQWLVLQSNYTWKKPGLSVAAFYRYTGPKPFLRGNVDGTTTFEGRQDGFHMADASVTKKLWQKKMQLTVGCKNIFNTTRVAATGLSGAAGGHSGSGAQNFLPRSGFATLQLLF